MKVGDLVKVENDLSVWYDEAYGVIIEIVGRQESPLAVVRVLLGDGSIGTAYLRNCTAVFPNPGEEIS